MINSLRLMCRNSGQLRIDAYAATHRSDLALPIDVANLFYGYLVIPAG